MSGGIFDRYRVLVEGSMTIQVAGQGNQKTTETVLDMTSGDPRVIAQSLRSLADVLDPRRPTLRGLRDVEDTEAEKVRRLSDFAEPSTAKRGGVSEPEVPAAEGFEFDPKSSKDFGTQLGEHLGRNMIAQMFPGMPKEFIDQAMKDAEEGKS